MAFVYTEYYLLLKAMPLLLLFFLFTTFYPPAMQAQTCKRGTKGCSHPALACSVARQFKKKYGEPILVSMVNAGRWSVEKAASMAEVFDAHCPDAN